MLRQKVGELQFCVPFKPGACSISAVRDRCAVLRVLKSGPRKDVYRLNTQPGITGEHLETLGTIGFKVRGGTVSKLDQEHTSLCSEEKAPRTRDTVSHPHRKRATRKSVRKAASLAEHEGDGEPLPHLEKKALGKGHVSQ